MEKNQDMLLEQQRLLSCLEIIRENIREYEEKEAVSTPLVCWKRRKIFWSTYRILCGKTGQR